MRMPLPEVEGMSAVRTIDLLAAYRLWQRAPSPESSAARFAADLFMDTWSKAPGVVKIWAAVRLAVGSR